MIWYLDVWIFFFLVRYVERKLGGRGDMEIKMVKCSKLKRILKSKERKVVMIFNVVDELRIWG